MVDSIPSTYWPLSRMACSLTLCSSRTVFAWLPLAAPQTSPTSRVWSRALNSLAPALAQSLSLSERHHPSASCSGWKGRNRPDSFLSFPYSPICSPSQVLLTYFHLLRCPRLSPDHCSRCLTGVPASTFAPQSLPEVRLWSQGRWVCKPGPSLIRCMTLGKLTPFSVPQNPHLWSGDNSKSTVLVLTVILGGLVTNTCRALGIASGTQKMVNKCWPLFWVHNYFLHSKETEPF